MMELGFLTVGFLMGACITLSVVAIVEIKAIMKEIDTMLGGKK